MAPRAASKPDEPAAEPVEAQPPPGVVLDDDGGTGDVVAAPSFADEAPDEEVAALRDAARLVGAEAAAGEDVEPVNVVAAPRPVGPFDCVCVCLDGDLIRHIGTLGLSTGALAPGDVYPALVVRVSDTAAVSFLLADTDAPVRVALDLTKRIPAPLEVAHEHGGRWWT